MKRLHYFDILRVMSFIAVVWYHLLVQLQIDEICNYQQVSRFFENSNMNIAMLAVSIFFILSGASLVYASRTDFDVRRFYQRRITKVWLPLIIMYVICFIGYTVLMRGFPEVFHRGIAPWKMLYTILGLDSLFSIYGVSTFTLGVGEWFIGCLIIYYALFPLLRAFLLKCRWGFVGLVGLVYIAMLWWQPWDVAVHQNIVIKGCEFCLGMMIGQWSDRISCKWLWGSVPILLIIGFCPVELPVCLGLRITMSALAVFVTFGALEPIWVSQNKWVMRVMHGIRRIGDYSYEGFLVHHEIIFFCTGYFFGRDLLLGQITRLLGVEVILICLGMVIYKWFLRSTVWRRSSRRIIS